MRKLLLGLVMLAGVSANATTAIPEGQGGVPIEGTPYYLPKTEMHFRLLIEKTTYTPGEYAIYSERYLKKEANDQPEVSYRLVGISMYTTAIPDSAKQFVVPIDKKHSIINVDKSSNGILLAINTKGKQAPAVPASFEAAPKAKAVNPHDFMSEDILAAGSTAKMAELTAREIYDIRESRNELSRGQADNLPKDGEQLKLMYANLDKQESILLQTFQGVTECDTLEEELVYCPKGYSNVETENADVHEMLFRFSKKLGLVDNDDLAGSPYYINIEDEHLIPELKVDPEAEKRAKDDIGIPVNMPGKVKVSITQGKKQIKGYELYLAQYGHLETLSSNMFGKKMTTHIQLDPVTGNVVTLETEPLD